MSEWMHEQLHAAYAQSLRVDHVLYDSATEHQRLRLFENATFGRVLTLDDVVQTTEADNFIYHEMMAHVPILAHGAAARVLIIGGGDGGLAREVLKHRHITNVTMVEIYAGVVAFARQFLPRLSAGAFDDPRLELVIDDGAAFMAADGPAFDVILVDSTDPVGPGEQLFTNSFYGHARRRLAPGGIMVTQNGVPFPQPVELTATMRAFAEWGCYLAHVPSYAGGPMALSWACDGAARDAALATLRERYAEAGLNSDYNTPAVHQAAFALQRYIALLLPDPTA